jgi:hypothetical protein
MQGPFHELHNPFRAISVRQRTGVSGHEAILKVPNGEEKERRLINVFTGEAAFRHVVRWSR